MAGSSYYEDSNAPITGEYRVGGLGPGQYYVLAFGFDEEMAYHNVPVQWYNGVEVSPEERVLIGPKADVPAGAITVAVGTGPTNGIDFYLNLSRKK